MTALRFLSNLSCRGGGGEGGDKWEVVFQSVFISLSHRCWHDSSTVIFSAHLLALFALFALLSVSQWCNKHWSATQECPSRRDYPPVRKSRHTVAPFITSFSPQNQNHHPSIWQLGLIIKISSHYCGTATNTAPLFLIILIEVEWKPSRNVVTSSLGVRGKWLSTQIS